MITSETFYRAECDHEGCTATMPTSDDDASHWTRGAVIEALAEERGADDETWTVVDELTFCTRHKPGNVECSACDGRGHFRAERDPATIPPGRGKWALTDCPVCERRGYIIATTDREDGSGREHRGAMCWCGRDHRFTSDPNREDGGES